MLKPLALVNNMKKKKLFCTGLKTKGFQSMCIRRFLVDRLNVWMSGGVSPGDY